MPLESLVSDAKMWSLNLESSITILEASCKFNYNVDSTGITYDNCLLKIVLCL